MCKQGVFLLICLLFGLVSSAARAGCSFAPDSVPTSITTMTLPLSVNNISVSPDTPVGTVIYRQDISLSVSGTAKVTCGSNGRFMWDYDYSATPLPETVAGSRIYKTGIEGVGIQFLYRAGLPFHHFINSSCTGSSCNTSAWGASSFFQLIKVSDPVVPGPVSGNNLPTARYSFGQSGNLVGFYEIKISGDLTINTPTCEVSPASQSMVVQLGTHKVSDFGGQYTGTAWKDASIQLNNCGWFYGNSSTSTATFNGTTNSTVAPLTQNRVRVNLSFYDTPVDALQGIMAIDGTQSYPAYGIGIQLSASQSTADKINLSAPYVFLLPNDNRHSVTVPLYARFVQTSVSAPLPGKANGRLEFVLSYE